MSEYIKNRLKSFQYAFEGIITLIKGTANARIHVFAALVAIAMGFWLKISTSEWVAITIVIGGVIALEAVNSAIEELADLITKKQNSKIKIIKDLSAGGVLIMAIVALKVGLFIFVPKIIELLN
ncbi:MAG: diacylglycerol kinase family protein [Proteiniphilum sp.]|nr:diacylglycerol kinase family protein [Proteiniphilum sp.]